MVTAGRFFGDFNYRINPIARSYRNSLKKCAELWYWQAVKTSLNIYDMFDSDIRSDLHRLKPNLVVMEVEMFGRGRRCSIRLKGYDYSQPGAYFVTLCTKNRACLFGNIVRGEMVRNESGQIIADIWEWMERRYDHVELDKWVIMPNHVHGILVITGDGRDGSPGTGGSRTAPTNTSSAMTAN